MKEILFIITVIIFLKNYKSEGFALTSDDIPKSIAERMKQPKNTNDIQEKSIDVKCPRKKIIENKKVKIDYLSQNINDKRENIGEEIRGKIGEEIEERIGEKIEKSVKVSGENTKKQLEKLEEIKIENNILNQNQTKKIQDLIISTSSRELDKLNEIDESIQELKKIPIVKYPESNKNTVLKAIIIFLVILFIGLFINYMVNKGPVIRRKIIRAPPLPPPPPPNIKLSLKEAKEIVTKNLMKYNV